MQSTAQTEATTRRAVVTRPPWAFSSSSGDYETPDPPYPPPVLSRSQLAALSRQHDRLREATPPTISKTPEESVGRWHRFIAQGPLPTHVPEGAVLVSPVWMKANLPNLEAQPSPSVIETTKQPEKATGPHAVWKKTKHALVNSIWVPFTLRLLVLAFTATALGLSGSIFHLTDGTVCKKGASTWLALIVDAVAVIYNGYVMGDEYKSPPLGLRPKSAKLSLLLLDLFFVVFDSANISLAFKALTDESWACFDDVPNVEYSTVALCPLNNKICNHQKALAGTLLVALIAWLTTFTISLFRVVEKIDQRRS
ncbi:uncharacterized protein BDZ99DRAFT_466781 [Mytilinidion resinicola]|uniref:Uncharacterized protein n=1 Tax=Mytilinidion resinicola TaxID=574789 RepID=A0A6A6Y8W2_9PEZI|nr:uncharacterized protein BDZ99DRAFT_466781 [Mytilinidion resinicola]KAF2805130.1 hypothetical protein BDZ99DRAFT_466781 [Mytilinidion resinicola]